MAGPNYVLDKGFKAGGAIGQYRAVELGAGETVTQCNAANDLVLGICQEEISAGDATNGRIADVRMLGISRCIAGANNIVIGGRVTIDNAGRVVPSPVAVGTTYAQVGIAMQASAAVGDHIDVFLTPGVAFNTAVS